MSALKIPLTEAERVELSAELDRLFILQDRAINEQRKAMLFSELVNSHYPFGAVIQGVRLLALKDLKHIKFWYLEEAIRGFVTEEFRGSNCADCNRTGRISMRETATGYNLSLACRCGNGDSAVKHQRLLRWEGSSRQTTPDGRELILYNDWMLGTETIQMAEARSGWEE